MENETIKKYPNRCQAIKKNGNPCRQCGKPQQNGGPIIKGYCNYHKELRENRTSINLMD